MQHQQALQQQQHLQQAALMAGAAGPGNVVTTGPGQRMLGNPATMVSLKIFFLFFLIS